MSTHPHTNLFTQVDRTKDPDFFVRFMDEAQKPPAIQASKRLGNLIDDLLTLSAGRGSPRHWLRSRDRCVRHGGTRRSCWPSCWARRE